MNQINFDAYVTEGESEQEGVDKTMKSDGINPITFENKTV